MNMRSLGLCSGLIGYVYIAKISKDRGRRIRVRRVPATAVSTFCGNARKLFILGCVAALLAGCGGSSGNSVASASAPTMLGSYTAALSLDNQNPGNATTDAATLVLSNIGSNTATAKLALTLPAGFSADQWNNACGASINTVSPTLININASILGNSSCKITAVLHIPTVAHLPATDQPKFLLASLNDDSAATLTNATVPSITILGSTPGLGSEIDFPAGTKASQLDFTITPHSDPGPNSDVFWSNQVDYAANTFYTGLQSTELSDVAEGHGKQFLFSWWGAKAAMPGTPASAGIGAGSFCTASNTATDGSLGVQCRYRYEWQANHTYRFRITPNPAIGPGWFQSTVTDTTATPNISFVIGNIQVDNTSTSLPVNTVSQWVEYFDWNDYRTACDSVPYTSAEFTTQGLDAAGHPIPVPVPVVSTNDTCPANYVNLQAKGAGDSLLEGGVQQSVKGYLRTQGQCLTAQAGLPDPSSTNTNPLILTTCPTLSNLQANSAAAYPALFWVMAGDGAVVTDSGYCMSSAANPTAGSSVQLVTCDPTLSRQQWMTQTTPAGTQILHSASHLCLQVSGQTVILGACDGSSSTWVLPGNSFSY
jgi:Domain of unknown function (DUF3472)/Ricin-type beta-trefoil lectin domain